VPRLVIEGGRCLRGTIGVSGAKNAALPILAACILNAGVCRIERVPRLRDIEVMQDLLVHLGASVVRDGQSMVVDTRGVESWEVPEELMRRMRASNLALGPLLGRFGRARMAYPGGCNIGARPMDLHLKGLQAMGARITERAGYITAEAHRLTGADIHLDLPSVGATENLMMAAVLAWGTTVIRNAAREPEIVDLQNFLNRLGARIRGAGTSVIKIEGVSGLSDATHAVIPDRIEAGTHLVAAAITGGDLTVTGCIPEHLEAVLAKLREAGMEVAVYDEAVRVWAPRKLRAVDLKTMPYPGFPTDMQAPFMALLTLAEGTSVVTETVFENRYKHVPELRRMGADIKLEGQTAIVRGVSRLSGACVEASDLRAGAALVLAGLAAENTTVVENVHLIDRGYEYLEEKYNACGARIKRLTD